MSHPTAVTLLEGVVGSVAHGLATTTSDVDRLAVHVAPIAEVLGLDNADAMSRTVVQHHPDRSSHELGKFAALALRCNPTILELLWVDRYDICTPDGARLVANRDAFLSTAAVRGSYGGYARSQVDRLLRRGDGSFSADTRQRTAKHARHCRRLLLQGSELLRTGTLHWSVAAWRDELFAAGEHAVADPAGFAATFYTDLAAFDDLDSVLPEHPRREVINDLVVQIRRDLAHL
jgi:predicted nucleotidyltransferase